MIFSIISSVFAGAFMVFMIVAIGSPSWGGGYSNIVYAVMLFIGVLQGVVAIVTSAFSCRAVCCRKYYPGTIV